MIGVVRVHGVVGLVVVDGVVGMVRVVKEKIGSKRSPGEGEGRKPS